jgi:hypothetical protein
MNKTSQIWSTILFTLSMIVCGNIVYQVLYKDIFDGDTFIYNLIPAVTLLILTSLTIILNRKVK